jgi:hypothetical protein
MTHGMGWEYPKAIYEYQCGLQPARSETEWIRAMTSRHGPLVPCAARATVPPPLSSQAFPSPSSHVRPSIARGRRGKHNSAASTAGMRTAAWPTGLYVSGCMHGGTQLKARWLDLTRSGAQDNEEPLDLKTKKLKCGLRGLCDGRTETGRCCCVCMQSRVTWDRTGTLHVARSHE